MNKIIKAEDLTSEEKNGVTLPFGRTWEDVESVNFQYKKDGSIVNYHVNYKYNCDNKGVDIVDRWQLLTGKKHSKAYQSAKKRSGISSETINSARSALEYINNKE
ncbi:hypothetical protein AB0X79_08165 [Pediococcus pentosaceus]|uniref:hypothetical protein n=1 Tax=Pediococcus pentosaceus TaxID=1255 RepID=UPI003F223EA4